MIYKSDFSVYWDILGAHMTTPSLEKNFTLEDLMT